MGPLAQLVPRRIRGQVTIIPLALATFTRQRTLADQPPCRPRGDPMMAGGELRATHGLVHPPGYELFAGERIL